MSRLSHIDDRGSARMVDVSEKPATERAATAEGLIILSAEAYAAAKSGNAPKGDILGTARIGGIMAAKRTSELIPLCHPVALTNAGIDFEWLDDRQAIRVVATAKTCAQTGVEMEALTAVAVAALTAYDMIKALDKSATIDGIRLLKKSGGESGVFLASVAKPSRPASAAVKTRARPKMTEAATPRPGPLAQREAFREFMASNRLRPTQWAKEAGIPSAQLLAYLTGQLKSLSPEAAKKLARAAKVRVEDMFR
jgi:cyclic pyranopterin phosphate synthase